uniref:Uncharacterized protein n=1 Tax=Arundo donax TaxID=35708 RepID=A0A0A9GI46_ARUDO
MSRAHQSPQCPVHSAWSASRSHPCPASGEPCTPPLPQRSWRAQRRPPGPGRHPWPCPSPGSSLRRSGTRAWRCRSPWHAWRRRGTRSCRRLRSRRRAGSWS